MLKQLQKRLQIFLIVIFMSVVSLILGFSFWNTWKTRQVSDEVYLQRMASLIIYQLEADAAKADALLAKYEKEMNIFSILKNDAGQLLFQSDPDTRTDLAVLGKIAEESTASFSADSAGQADVTRQGGYGEIKGDHQDRYYVIPATVRTKSGEQYSLALFYEQPSLKALLLRQAPGAFAVWLLSFVCIFFVSRFLLRRAFAPTERVLKSQKGFVASASHELKSPLAVIMANAETLQTLEGENPRIQHQLQVIDTECMRMSRLVRDMLFLASSDAGQWTLQKENVNIDTLLITLYEAYEPICRKKSIPFSLNPDEGPRSCLCTDRERLFQILSIFLDNAVSYSPGNRPVELKTRQTAKEWAFFVVDHGKGISDAEKPLIFDRFYCADKAHTDKSHFGLGLSIAKELARMLAGKIILEDTPGGGATFCLTLPVK